MAYQTPSFTTNTWDGTSPTYPSRQINTHPDSSMTDRFISEIVAIQGLLYDAVAEIEFLGTLGANNSIIGVATDGTGLKYKALTSGNNITITSANDTITIDATEASSLTLSNNSGATINICEAVYSSAANAVTAAQGDASATSKVVGLAHTTINNDSTGNIITEGVLIATTGEWDVVTGGSGGLTYGTTYYLDDATAGAITSTAPTASGNFVTKVGVAISTTTLVISLEEPIIPVGSANTVQAVATDGSSVLYKTLTSGNNVSIVSANDTITISASEASSTTISNNSGSTINICEPVYSSATNAVTTARADVAGTSKAIGLAAETMTDAATGNIITEGLLVATTGEWDAVTGASGGLTAGATYYLGDAAAGKLVTTAPTASGNFVTQLGVALSTTVLIIDPVSPVIPVGAANTVQAVATDGTSVLYKTLTEGSNIGIVSANDTITITATENSLVPISNNSGSTVNICMPIYMSGSNAITAAQGDAAATSRVVGVATETMLTDNTGNISIGGTVAATTGQWDTATGDSGGLTPNAVYYLSDATAGGLTTTAPTASGNFVVKVGIALSTTVMSVDPELPVIPVGSANTVQAVATDGTSVLYKALTSGNNITITSANDTITIASTETSMTPVSNNSGATINICMPVYASADDAVTAALGDALATSKVIGLAHATMTDSTTGNVVTDGTLTATTGEWDTATGGSGGLTAGSTYYLDAATAGSLTTTAPTTGNYVTKVGIALSTTTMIVDVEVPELATGSANTVRAVATDGTSVLYKTLTAGDNIGIVSANDTITITAYEASSEPVSNNSGATINIGMAVYASGANAITAAQANSLATSKVIGLAQEEMTDASTGNIITEGLLTLTTGQWDALTGASGGLTAGTTYYLDDAVSGNLTATVPTGSGNYVAKIGTALSETTLIVDTELPETVIGSANTVRAVATDGTSVLYKTLTSGNNIGIVSANDTITINAIETSRTQVLNNSGATINICTPVYVSSTLAVTAAQADTLSTSNVVGLAFETIANSSSGIIVTEGAIAATTGQWDAVTGDSGGLTAGAEYYLDDVTVGSLTTTAPTASGNYVTGIGVALSTTTLLIHARSSKIPLGDANTVRAISTDGTADLYKTITAGDNMSVVSTNSAITLTSTEVSLTTVSNNSGATINECMPVYSSGANQASAANAATLNGARIVGFMTENTADAATGNIQTQGVLAATTAAWDAVTGGSGGLDYGTTYYLSDATAGNLVTTPTTTIGHYVAKAGIAISTTQLVINPERQIKL